MTNKSSVLVYTALAGLALTSAAAFAEEHAFTEGPVVNVAAIRTEPGKFDEYMKFLATTWKAEQEAGKKMGDVINYKVITVEPRSENDPDLYLVVTYKNWATLDGATAKSDAVAKQIEGSVDASNKGTVDRGKIRRVLGSFTGQELNLK
jgi:hypothetical protein